MEGGGLQQILAKLAACPPLAGQVYLVGGAVRDSELGRPQPTDLDFATEMDPTPFVNELHRLGLIAGAPVVYPRFGTAKVDMDGFKLEFAAMRAESYGRQSRKPDVKRANLAEDALRRDFTCNALYQKIMDREIIDPTGFGQADLKKRILRTPHGPAKTFQDDPLRMFRAVRFKWKLGFEFAEGLKQAIQSQAARVEILSPERIREELMAMLALPSGPQALEDLRALLLLEHFWPEFGAMKGVDQGAFHHLDVWDHTRLVITRLWEQGHAEPDTVLAALFHDIGKPETRTVDQQGKVRFFGHESVGAQMTQVAMRRLRFSEEQIACVSQLVCAHMRLGQYKEFGPSGVRRLMRDMGPQLGKLLNLVEADSHSLAPGVEPLPMAEVRERFRICADETPVESLKSPLNGTEICETLGISPGKLVGQAKTYLQELVLSGELPPNDKDLARKLLLENWPQIETKPINP